MSYVDMSLLSAIIGGLIGIFGTMLAVYLTKKRKRIAYEITSVSPLVSVSDEIRDKIKIEYFGNPIKDIYFFKVKIKNIGNAEVEKLPILFEFDSNTEILDVTSKTIPEKIGIKNLDVNKESERKYEVDFLNPKDQIFLSFLTANNKSDYLKLHARAKGLRFHEAHIVSFKELLIEILKTAI
jgi:hypothetical protein